MAFVFAGIVLHIVALLRPEWRWFAPTSEILQSLVGLVLLRLALKIPPYFVVPHGLNALPKYVLAATIINQQHFWSIFGLSIGFGIAILVDS